MARVTRTLVSLLRLIKIGQEVNRSRIVNCVGAADNYIDLKMGISVKDVNQHEFTKALAAFLKKSGKLKVPEWADIVKLGRFKELSPYDEDWFYTRAASTCRHLYIRSPAGVGAFTKIYGGKKKNGTAPSHNCRANRSVARKVLQALEGLKLVEKDPNTGGRRLTGQGRRDLDRIAAQVKSKKTES